MGWKATLRAIEAAERRQQREAQRRKKELERRTKEQAKLSALEQSRLEVETHENLVEVLLSVHKEQGQEVNWRKFAAALPPPVPSNLRLHEKAVLLQALNSKSGVSIEAAIRLDEIGFQEALQAHTTAVSEMEEMRRLAERILSGDHAAYAEALAELSPLSEISSLGSSAHFTVHSSQLVECRLRVNGTHVIPSEVKSLSASGKLSTKAMPRGRFHEIYQDHVCGCQLRVAREVFALLPIEIVLITASVEALDSATGIVEEQAVLSVSFPRQELIRLNFEHLDPSDAIEAFQHRGDFKISRKAMAFQRITPISPQELSGTQVGSRPIDDLFARVSKLRDELGSKLTLLSAQPLKSAQ